MDTAATKRQWMAMCQSIQSHADSMRHVQSDGHYADLIDSEVWAFTAQAAPRDDAEVASRQSQHLGLMLRMGAIVNADAMAKKHPKIADAILKATTQWCQRRMPVTSDELRETQLDSLTLTSAISSLCRTDALAMMTGMFKDAPDFDEIVRLGRDITNSGDSD